MFTKTKIALAASLVLGSASLALADDHQPTRPPMRCAPAVQSPDRRELSSGRPPEQRREGPGQNWMDRSAPRRPEGGGY